MRASLYLPMQSKIKENSLTDLRVVKGLGLLTSKLRSTERNCSETSLSKYLHGLFYAAIKVIPQFCSA